MSSIYNVLECARDNGWSYRREVWGTHAWRADFLLYRNGACINLEHERARPKKQDIHTRTLHRLASGVWTFWVFDEEPPLIEPFFTPSPEKLESLFVRSIPFLTPSTPFLSTSTCKICHFPRRDVTLGAFCWRCCFCPPGFKFHSSLSNGRRVYDKNDVIEFQQNIASLPRKLEGVFIDQFNWREQQLYGVVAEAKRKFAEAGAE